MHIELKPETEEMIRQEVQRGAYRNAAEVVEQAVALLHEQQERLGLNRNEIAASIEAGYASARRGNLIDDQQVRVTMAERKQKWLAQTRSLA